MYYGKDKILYRTIKADRLSSIILFGPPGCGKTLAAHAIAGEIGIPMLYVRFDALISSYLGVQPIKINSALVSAQNRVRLYWTNIEGVEQPEDKHIYLKDIILHEGDFKYPTETRIKYVDDAIELTGLSLIFTKIFKVK